MFSIDPKKQRQVKKSKKITGRYTITLDDDPAIPKIIEGYMGISSLHFSSAQKLQEEAAQYNPVGAFIDINLGTNQSGLEVIPTLRNLWIHCPLLVITADPKDELVSQALGSGADDFLRKPINPVELMARLQLRLSDLAEKEGNNSEKMGDLTIERSSQTIRGPNGVKYLSNTEMNLLLALAHARGTVVTKSALKRAGWKELAVSDNALIRKIHEIRKSLKDVGTKIRIRTQYGSGFSFETETKKTTRTPPLSGKILVVEDDDVNRELVLRMLSALGYRAKGAHTGEQALEQLSQNQYDLVLLDRNLPGIRGDEICRQIRSTKNRHQSIPIIIMTAELLTRGQHATLIDDINDELTKPFSFDDLEAMIKRWLQLDSQQEKTTQRDDKPQPQSSPETSSDPLASLQIHGKTQLISELIDIFVEQMPDLLDCLDSAIKKKDRSEIKQITHKLQGRCGNLGVFDMVESAKSIDHATGQGQWERARSLAGRLRVDFLTTTQSLTEKWGKAA